MWSALHSFNGYPLGIFYEQATLMNVMSDRNNPTWSLEAELLGEMFMQKTKTFQWTLWLSRIYNKYCGYFSLSKERKDFKDEVELDLLLCDGEDLRDRKFLSK